MTKIYHAHLWGSREDKYRYLLENDVNTVEWTELNPESPFYLFIPQNTDLFGEYEQYFKIIDFPRVPLTSNQQLFQDLGEKGQELVELHLSSVRQMAKRSQKSQT